MVFKHGNTGSQLEILAVRYLFPHSVIDDSLEDKDVKDLEMLRMHFHLQLLIKIMTSNQLRADIEIVSFI